MTNEEFIKKHQEEKNQTFVRRFAMSQEKAARIFGVRSKHRAWLPWEKFDAATVGRGMEVRRPGKNLPRFRVDARLKRERPTLRLYGPLGSKPMMSGMAMVPTFFEVKVADLYAGGYRMRRKEPKKVVDTDSAVE